MKKILVVGSGKKNALNANKFDKVYAANSAFTRLLGRSNLSLVLSEAMFFSESDLNHHPTVINMDRESSNALRVGKYSVIDGSNFEHVITVNNGGFDIKGALERKRMDVEILTLMNNRNMWDLFFSSFRISEITKIIINITGLSDKFRFILQYLFKKRMSAKFRPSTGVIAIMLAFEENPNSKIYIDGINIYDNEGKRQGFYDSGSITYKDDIHMLDPLYCQLFINKGLNIYQS
jgi:hypothetical protein